MNPPGFGPSEAEAERIEAPPPFLMPWRKLLAILAVLLHCDTSGAVLATGSILP